MNRVNRLVGQLRPSATHGGYASSSSPAAGASSGVTVSALSCTPAVECSARADTPASSAWLLSAHLGKIRRTKSLKGKTVFITGASRGIGLSIALRAAREGANVVIAAKTTEPHPKLPGTIYTAAAEVEKAGGRALPIKVDIRNEDEVLAAVEQAVAKFGGIDIVVNNASAINLTPTEMVTMKRYDLMHQVNGRGTFLVSKCCIPYLKKSDNPHILTISPPLNMEERWFAPHVAYTMAKFTMSMVVLGMAGEFRDDGIAVNALWPKTTIATAAVNNLLGGDEMMKQSRTPEIMGDAAFEIFLRNSREVTGQYFIDEDVLRQGAGMNNFAKYAVVPGTPDSDLAPDFFI